MKKKLFLLTFFHVSLFLKLAASTLLSTNGDCVTIESQRSFINNRVIIELINEVGDPICEYIPLSHEKEVRTLNCESGNNIISFSPIFTTTYVGRISSPALNLGGVSFVFSVNANGITFQDGNHSFFTCDGEPNGKSFCVRHWQNGELVLDIYFESTGSVNGIYNDLQMFILINDEYCNGEFQAAIGQCEVVGFQIGLEDREIKNDSISTPISAELGSFSPNPFQDIIKLKLNQEHCSENYIISIFDSRGSLIIQKIYNCEEIASHESQVFETQNFAIGIYYCIVMSDGVMQEFKIIKYNE